jgi:iron complex transport system permease protein
MQVQTRKQHYFVLVTVLLIPLVLFGGITIGSVEIPISETVTCMLNECKDSVTEDIIWKIRLPRTLAALVGGAGLALAGTLLQSLFRNPLAGPGVLGITSGASLGVAVLIMGGLTVGITVYSYGTEMLFTAALVGSLFTTILIIGMIRFVSNATTLLLVGLMINWVLGSIISVLGILAQQQNLQVFYVWTLGSFSGITWESLQFLYMVIPIATLVVFSIHKKMDTLLLGESYATSMGVNVSRLRKIVIILSSILAAIVTSIAGPVGFIGIAGPYLARLTTNSGSHRIIIPAAVIFGALLTAGADILARILISPVDLPISVITAVIGAPLIISLLIKRKGEGLVCSQINHGFCNSFNMMVNSHYMDT